MPNKPIEKPYSTVLLDHQEQLLGAKIAQDGQWRFPVLDSLNPKYEACLLMFEDQYFYYHPGLNPASLWAALQTNLSKGKIKRGGSTITMQLARMARDKKRRNYSQKAIEIVYALLLEARHSKKSILHHYAANAPYGGNVVGVETASWRYFGVSSERLSWAQAATLAVLPNAPSLIFPGKNQAQLKTKRNALLTRLHQAKKIDRVQYELALEEPLPEKPFALPQKAPHLLEQSIQDGHAGTFVKTTLNSHWQEQAQNRLFYHMQYLQANDIQNVAALVMEVSSGKVLVYIGNTPLVDPNKNSCWVNMMHVPRSTGSILKPFLYAACLNEGVITPNSLVRDIPVSFEGYSPSNYSRNYLGAVPAYQCLSKSLNVPSVFLLKEYGIGKFIQNLQDIGFSSIHRSEDFYGLSLILGGAEASLWEATSAYANAARIIENFGENKGKHQPSDIRLPHYLPTVIQAKNNRDYFPYQAGNLWLMMDALQKLQRPEEDGHWQQYNSARNIAWKTGTSFGQKDAWAIGVDSRYAVGIWVGNSDNEGRPGLTGINAAAPMMLDVFQLLPTAPEFLMPYDALKKTPVCKQSGYLMGLHCEQADTVWMPRQDRFLKPCPYHISIHVNQRGERVHLNCVTASEAMEKKWFVLPPAIELYYKQHQAQYTPLPAFKIGCEELMTKNIGIIYPPINAKLFAPKDFNQQKNQIVFQATHRRPEKTLFWYIDDQYIGNTQQKHDLPIYTSTGKHKLTLMDEDGEELVRYFEMVE